MKKLLNKLANPNLSALVPYEPGKPIDDVARELGLDPSSISKLASNENPLGPSPKALKAITEMASQTHIYPDGGGFHLRQTIAEHNKLSKSQVVLGNGSNEIIELAYHAFTRPGHTSVIASSYAFVVYKLMAQLFDVEFIETSDRNFAHDLDAMKASIKQNTRLVFIANPNNPTGTLIPTNELKSFIESLPEHVICVLDEAYYEFLKEPPPSIEWLKQFPNLIILRTFSKIQGLAALRVGYGITREDTAEALQRSRQPFNVNAIAQAAALEGFKDLEHQNKTKDITHQGLARLRDFCEANQIPYLPSYANFLMMNVKDADRVFHALLQKGVIVRSLKSYGLPEWIRVSIGTAEQMTHFEEELVSCINE
ncbi:MAG: histidinol-phosphate transaminase [Verrucomicrobiota bacterium]